MVERAPSSVGALPKRVSTITLQIVRPLSNISRSEPTATGKKLVKPNLGNRRNDSIGGGWFLLLVPISTFVLGTWQIERKKWKEELIELVASRMQMEPIPLPDDLNQLADLEYRPVKVKGRFDHENESYLGPRSLFVGGDSIYLSKLFSGKPNDSSGYNVITPFILSETGEKVLVNRGWVPFPLKNPSKRLGGQIKEEIEITGVVRHSEPHPKYSPLNKLDVRVWFSRDVNMMSEAMETLPVFLDASVETTVEDGPIGGQTRASFRNEHLSYILTWYSLSLFTGFLWYTKYIKRVAL